MLHSSCLTFCLGALGTTLAVAVPAINGGGEVHDNGGATHTKGNPPAGLLYFPEYGVTYTQLSSHPKYFDDTDYMGIANDNKNYRVIKSFSCKAESSENVLIGLSASYDFNGNTRWTSYHGWDRALVSKYTKSHTLEPGELFKSFTIRQCGKKIVGIKVDTTKKNGVAECGAWQYDISEDTTCEETTLEAKQGYHIVGLYGDSNGTFHTKRQGIRGLGLITAAN